MVHAEHVSVVDVASVGCLSPSSGMVHAEHVSAVDVATV